MTQQAVHVNTATMATDSPADSATQNAITIRDIVHRYPPVSARRSSHKGKNNKPVVAGTARALALDHLSLDIPKGGIFALLGPNGGGKSTLFKIIATMLKPTSGSVSVMGHDVNTQGHIVRSHLGVLFQMPSLDIQLTAYENLRHQGHLYGLSGTDLKNRINTWLDRLGLTDNRDDRVMAFSGGMRRRLELAKALLHRPSILLLDEPASGLDPAARRDVWQHLTRLRDEEGVTVALTTHMMDEADKSDRLAIVNDGKLVAVDTPANLKAKIGGDVVTVTPKASHAGHAGQATATLETLRQRIETTLGPWDNKKPPRIVDDKVFIEHHDGPSFVATLGAALSNDIQSITVGQPTLEDVFMQLTGKAIYGQNSA